MSFDPSPRRDLLPNRRYLVGVSGGRDSVALLHWLVSLGCRRLIVCHFNHQLRGRSGSADARFVARLARQYQLEYVGGASDIRRLAGERRQSIETVGRAERYAFFEGVGKRHRCLRILLAHHADDQVETFLFTLLRGAGSRGLGAMRTRSHYRGLTILRPWLGVWRTEIDDYVRQHRLKFREDATNQDLQAHRNRMRRNIIPYLERKLDRKLRATLARTADILAEEDDYLESLIPPGLTSAKDLPVPALRALAPALQRRVLRNWLMRWKVSEVSFMTVEAVRQLLIAEAPAKVNLAGNRHARRRAGKIFLE